MHIYAAVCVSSEPGENGFILRRTDDPAVVKALRLMIGQIKVLEATHEMGAIRPSGGSSRADSESGSRSPKKGKR